MRADMGEVCGGYRVEYDSATRYYYVICPDGLRWSNHATLEHAMREAKAQIAEWRERAKRKIIARIPHREACGDR